MSTEIGLLIGGLAIGTFAMRLFGAIAGEKLASRPGIGRLIELLPGCLIVSLVAVSIGKGNQATWIVAFSCVGIAAATRNLLLTMATGIGLAAFLGAR